MVTDCTNHIDIIATLGQSNRICEVSLIDLSYLADQQLEKILAAMQVPFPELTDLKLSADCFTARVNVAIPDSFLGGSAPRLRTFALIGIPFPGMPKFLLTATHLYSLYLSRFAYISPEAIVALISVLSNLRRLTLELGSPQSRGDQETQRSPPPKRSILPSLVYFRFNGVIEYLEDLVTFIDFPQLKEIYIHFFNQNQIDVDCPRLAQFINRTPKLRKCDKAHVYLEDWSTCVLFGAPQFGTLQILIPYIYRQPEPNRRLLSAAQVCGSLFPSTVEDLYIKHQLYLENDAIESTLWLQLFLPFIAVKNLHLQEELAPGIAAALQELVGDRITEVLPSLQNIFVEELEALENFKENIGQFIAARQLSGIPIAIYAGEY